MNFPCEILSLALLSFSLFSTFTIIEKAQCLHCNSIDSGVHAIIWVRHQCHLIRVMIYANTRTVHVISIKILKSLEQNRVTSYRKQIIKTENMILNLNLPEVFCHQATQVILILKQYIDLQIHHLVYISLVSVFFF